ncbi:MAG: glycosyltransferase [Candidatus Rokuibacteriota bacterium]
MKTSPAGALATISVVLVVHNQNALTQACVETLRRTRRAFQLCVVDNASDDETESVFANWSDATPLRYHRNAENVGLIRALNQGARLAGGDRLCFLHNDTEMLDSAWLDKLDMALTSGNRVGLAGLYGARRLRRNGRYAGRSIVHCLAEGPTLLRPVVEVAAVDGVCLFISRALLHEVGGFDEDYGFFHGYDRDLSLAVRAAGYRCAVVNALFVHRGGGTRMAAGAPATAAKDLAQRREALGRLVQKWGHALPTDVRTLRERLADRLRRRR